jgi:hypothetical protein
MAAGGNATTADTTDAKLAFAGPLVAPCPYTDDDGAERSEPCGSGVVTVTATYFEVRCSLTLVGCGRLHVLATPAGVM